MHRLSVIAATLLLAACQQPAAHPAVTEAEAQKIALDAESTFTTGDLGKIMDHYADQAVMIDASTVNPSTDRKIQTGWAKNFIFPWITLALAFAATYTRFTRSNVLETSSEDYIRTARAKGLSEKVVLRKHILRAALAPILTIAGLDFAGLLGGAIITENIFNLPGLGRMSIRAVLTDYDLPIILATTLLAASFVVVMNLVVDIAYAYIDPRVRVA